MTNLVPHDIEEWMRTQERRYMDLATRRIPGDPRDLRSPRWRSNLTSDVTVSNATITWLAFDDSSSDPTAHSPAGESNSFFVYSAPAGLPRYTAQVAGLYLIQTEIQWSGGVSGTRKLHITVNNAGDGVPRYTSELPGNTNSHQFVGGPVALDAGGFFRIGAYQTSGGNITIVANSESTSTSGGRAPSNLSIIPVGSYEYDT